LGPPMSFSTERGFGMGNEGAFQGRRFDPQGFDPIAATRETHRGLPHGKRTPEVKTVPATQKTGGRRIFEMSLCDGFQPGPGGCRIGGWLVWKCLPRTFFTGAFFPKEGVPSRVFGPTWRKSDQ